MLCAGRACCRGCLYVAGAFVPLGRWTAALLLLVRLSSAVLRELLSKKGGGGGDASTAAAGLSPRSQLVVPAAPRERARQSVLPRGGVDEADLRLTSSAGETPRSLKGGEPAGGPRCGTCAVCTATR